MCVTSLTQGHWGEHAVVPQLGCAMGDIRELKPLAKVISQDYYLAMKRKTTGPNSTQEKDSVMGS